MYAVHVCVVNLYRKKNGALFVITTGIYLKLEWQYADNYWDTTTAKVSLNFELYNSYSSNLN